MIDGFAAFPVLLFDISLAAILVVIKDDALIFMLTELVLPTTILAAPPVYGFGRNHISTPFSPVEA